MSDYKSILFEQMIKDYAENEVKPLAQEVDEQERFPAETVEKMAKLGLMGIIVPKQYGGAGGNYPMYISAVEEISKACGTTGVILSAHMSLCVAPILEYAQAWLDITSLDYYFNEKDAALYKYYSMVVPQMLQKDEAGNVVGVPGFTESYWEVAKDIYNYVVSIGRDDGFSMSYNSYALAGYIAGNLFCQALEEMEAQGKELTRANLVDILESKKFQVAMADMISYQNGERAGVQSFSLTVFYDTNTVTNDGKHVASSMTVHPLTSMDEYRALIGK